MASWTLPDAPELRPVTVSDQDRLFGPDVYFRGDYVVTPAGDYAVVSGVDVGHQSLEREAMASPGELVHRPDWGMGVRAALYRPQTRSSVDELRTRVETRARENPRVSRVREVAVRTTTFADGKHGVEIDVRADVGGRDSRIPTIRVPVTGGGGT